MGSTPGVQRPQDERQMEATGASGGSAGPCGLLTPEGCSPTLGTAGATARASGGTLGTPTEAGWLVSVDERLRAGLTAAVSQADVGTSTADRLCSACVDLLDVEGAALSLALDATTRGTLGASSALSRRLDGLQHTLGQGPSLDATSTGRPVLVDDLDDPAERRWPGFADAVLDAGIRAVFALPVSLSHQCVGALSLYRVRSGPLSPACLRGGLLAAELASLPLLDVIAEHKAAAARGMTDDGDQDDGSHVASLERVEVYQATGMIIGALDVDPAEALARLRAQAFVRGVTATELAWEVVERRVSLDSPDWHDLDGPAGVPQ